MRGTGTFSPELLINQLAPFSPENQGLPETIGDYYRFYDVDFGATIPGVRHTMGWLASGEHRIVAQLFAPSQARGTAIVCHGYYDHVGLYGHLIEFLLGLGLNVLSFDQPGHGLSSGARASIGSFDEYVRCLADTLEVAAPGLVKPWYLIGQSMGGAITMEYLVQHDPSEFSQLVLLAPLIRPANWTLSRVVFELARRVIKERPRTLTANAENEEFMALMKVDPLAPQTLPIAWVSAMIEWMQRFKDYPELPFSPRIVQGHADKTVDWKHNLHHLREKTDAHVLEIPHARHHLVNESEQIRQHMFDWLKPYLGG